MYTGILHTHTLVVVLFLLLYLVKTYLLVFKKHEALAAFTEKTKWPERIISILFLATGIFLLVETGNKSWMLYLKIGLVFASIPLAIVGFKRKISGLAILSLVLLFASYGLAEMNAKYLVRKPKPEVKTDNPEAQAMAGKVLYAQYCTPCHGENGDAANSGAKNLVISKLEPAAVKSMILNGKGIMPAFSQLSDAEAEALVLHCMDLRMQTE